MDGFAVWTLLGSSLMLGLAGSVHCASMCGPACAVLTGSPGAWHGALAFQLGRLAGYSGAGALAAGGVQWLGWAAAVAPVLGPLWALLHAAALALGLWLLVTGRQPAVMARWGRKLKLKPRPRPIRPTARDAAASTAAWQPVHLQLRRSAGDAKLAALGAAWMAWPCGLLQAAIVLAALGNGPAQGAAAMACFAIASSPALVAGPAALRWASTRWLASAGAGADGSRAAGALAQGALARANLLRDNALRLAGLVLAAASAWALGHELWRRTLTLCLG